MGIPVTREEVQSYLQACLTFEEFSRYNELTPDELEAIERLSQALGLTLYRIPVPQGPDLDSRPHCPVHSGPRCRALHTVQDAAAH